MVDTQISNALSGNKHADSELRGATQESWRRADFSGLMSARSARFWIAQRRYLRDEFNRNHDDRIP